MKMLKTIFTSFLRDKKLILYILIISITLGLLMIIYNLKIFVEKIYKTEIENNIKNRTLFISQNETDNINLDDILNIPNIEKTQYILTPLTLNMQEETINVKSSILLDNSKLLYGKNCDHNSVEMVISNSMKNALELLNTTVNINYRELKLDVKIVGIYDDETKQNYSYISEGVITNLIQCDENIIDYSTCLAVVNKYENLNNTIKQLENNKFSCNIYDTSELTDIKTYKSMSNIFGILISIIATFIYAKLSMIVSNIINDEKKNIAILKAIGYRELDLFKIIFYMLLSIILVSFIFGILIQRRLSVLFCHKIIKVMNSNLNYNINFNPIYYIIVFLILTALVIIISLKSLRKIKLIDTIILLKE